MALAMVLQSDPTPYVDSPIFGSDSKYLESVKAMATMATRASSHQIPSDYLSRLPKEVLKRILRFLLVSSKPVILGFDVERPLGYSTGLDPTILRSCYYINSIGIEVLYSYNTFTTSSPASSVDFDKHLLSLPSRTLQLVRHVRLDIDWAEELWVSLFGALSTLLRMSLQILFQRHVS